MTHVYRQTKAKETKNGVTLTYVTTALNNLNVALTSLITTTSGSLHDEIIALTDYVNTISGTLQDGLDSFDPLPTQSGHTGSYLKTDGTDPYWDVLDMHDNTYHTDTYATDVDLTTLSGLLQVNIDDSYTTLDNKIDTTSGTLQAQIAGISMNHDELSNLDYESAGHTGFFSAAEATTMSGILQSGIDSKEDSFSKNTAFNKNFGSASDTVCEGNDSRLSDSRTPTSHGNEAHSSTFITGAGVTYENLSANGDIGTGSTQVSQGNHSHAYSAITGTHGNEDHSSTFITSAGVTYENLNANSDVGTGSTQVAQGDHTHSQISMLDSNARVYDDNGATPTHFTIELDGVTQASFRTNDYHYINFGARDLIIYLASGRMRFSDGGASIGAFSTDGTLSGNSDTTLSTEKAIKTYVDTTIPNYEFDGVILKSPDTNLWYLTVTNSGTLDVSAYTP